MNHLVAWLAVASLGLTGCIAVPVRNVSYGPGFIQFGPEQTVLIDVVKEVNWKWFIATILPRSIHSGPLGQSCWTKPSVRKRYAGTRVVNLARGTCRLSQRSQPLGWQMQRRFRQVVLPASVEQRTLSTGASPSYTLQVIRDGEHPALKVVGPTGSRSIALGDIESKVYWIADTDLAHTAGRLVSLSTGAIFTHGARYVRAFVRGKQLYVVIPPNKDSKWQGELIELTYPDLKPVRSIYRGNRMVMVDYDGTRFLFASQATVEVFHIETNRWVKASHMRCGR